MKLRYVLLIYKLVRYHPAPAGSPGLHSYHRRLRQHPTSGILPGYPMLAGETVPEYGHNMPAKTAAGTCCGRAACILACKELTAGAAR